MAAAIPEWLVGFEAWLRARGCTSHWVACCINRMTEVDGLMKCGGLEPAQLEEPQVQSRVLRAYAARFDRPPPHGLYHLRGSLRYFLLYARETGLIASEDWLTSLTDWMRAGGYPVKSISNYLSKLRTVATFLADWGWEPTRLAEPEAQARVLERWRETYPISTPGLRARLQLLCAIHCWLRYARERGLVAALDPEARPVRTRAWLEPLALWLKLQGYRRRVVLNSVCCLATVGDYLAARGLEPAQLAEPEVVTRYLRHRESTSSRPGAPVQRVIKAAIGHWLAYARSTGLIEPRPQPSSPLVEQFLHFARDHHGLSASSLRHHRRHLIALTDFAADRGHPSLVDLPVQVLDEFVGHNRRSRSEVARVTGSVRSLLRYLFLVGLEERDRSRWVEGPRMYRNERLPLHLRPEQLEAALARVDRSSEHGKKVWAVLSLLNTYGLRIGEVAGLHLSDLSLEQRWLRVARTKTLSESLYPLTPAVKEALREYLEVRPASGHPELFLTTRAPYRPYRNGNGLAACVRAVLAPVVGTRGQGAHSLRHTLALRLRQGGVSLGLTRQILGHRTSDATGRYLRIAVDELREVAQNYADLLEHA